MNKKGQALVEFIIIMPVMLFILLTIIDFGLYNYNKTKLEGILNSGCNVYDDDEKFTNCIYLNDKLVVSKINNYDEYKRIELTKKYDFITPGLDFIFKTNDIKVERVVYYE